VDIEKEALVGGLKTGFGSFAAAVYGIDHLAQGRIRESSGLQAKEEIL